jgi:uncharacterized protein HemX
MQSPDGQWTWNGTQWVPAQQQAQAPKKRPVGLIVGVLAALVVIIIGAALYSNHQRTEQVKQQNDQLLRCEFPNGSWVPPDQRPAGCPR